MKPVIPFIAKLSGEEQQRWLELLQQALPEEHIVEAMSIPEEQRSACEIAIVADPEPAEVESFTNLKWVQSVWAGVDRLVQALRTSSIASPPKIARLVDPRLAHTMSEAALAWSFYLQRNMPDYASQQRTRQWKQLPYRLPEEVCIGILGLGALGLSCAERLQKNGFQVCGWSKSPKSINTLETHTEANGLITVLRQSQILLILLPLTPDTLNLLDQTRLSNLSEGASVINFARGPILNVDALLTLLDRGHIKHAVLDVFDQEPLPKESPLWSRDDITLLPHISAPTSPVSASQIVAKNIKQYRESDELPPTVDVSQGY